MALADEIAVKLGLSTTQFKQALKDAGADISKFKKDASDTKGLDAFFGNFQKKLGDMKALGSALAVALGINFQQIAENFARAVTGMSKDAEEALKRIASQDEQIAKNAQDLARSKLTLQQQYQAALEDAAKAQRDIDNNNSSGDKRREEINDAILRLQNAQVAALKLEDQISSELTAKDRVYAEEKKRFQEDVARAKREQAEYEKKLLDEEGQAALDYYKKSVALDKELRAQRLDSLKPAERIVALESDIAGWKREQLQYDKLSNEYKQRQIKINEANLAIEKARVKVAKEATQEQINALEAQQRKDLNESMYGGGTTYQIDGKNYGTQARSAEDFSRASTAELQELIRRNRAEAAAIEAGKGHGPTALAEAASGYLARGIVQAVLQTEIQRAMYQISQRESATNDYGGIEGARRNYQGDPLSFDAFYSSVQGQGSTDPTLKNIDDGITDINERLRVAGFGTGGG